MYRFVSGFYHGSCRDVCALTLRDHRETPIIVIVLIALGIGLLAGLLNGFIVAKLRIFPLIGTLGVCDMLRGLVYVFSKGAWVGQGDMTQEFMSISTGKVFGINNLVFIAILITVMGYIFLQYFRNGRYMYAVGNNELSAKISGINPVRTKFLAYVINGMIAGLAGMLWICKFGNAQGESCSSYELNVIALWCWEGYLLPEVLEKWRRGIGSTAFWNTE